MVNEFEMFDSGAKCINLFAIIAVSTLGISAATKS